MEDWKKTDDEDLDEEDILLKTTSYKLVEFFINLSTLHCIKILFEYIG